MKYFNLIILTFLTVIHVDAADVAGSSTPLSGQNRRFSTTGSEGSCPGSRMSNASSILSKHAMYETAVEIKNAQELLAEYAKLRDAYHDLLKLTSKTDVEFAHLVQGLENTLPNFIRDEAGENDLAVLRKGVIQLAGLYNRLKRTYNTSTGKVAELESTVAELKRGYDALLETMAPRPTEHMSTDMSPPRKAAVEAEIIDSSAAVLELRAKLKQTEAERDRLRAEITAVQLELARSSREASKYGETEPLLGERGAAAPRANNQGCPTCSVQ